MRTEKLANELLQRFPDIKVARGMSSFVLSKRFPDGTKVIMQISPEGDVLSTYISRITEQSILFTEEVKEYLWERRSKVGI